MLHTSVTILNLEKQLTKSENIRRDLVEVNRILMVAIQSAMDQIRSNDDLITSRSADGILFLLETTEAKVKRISIREY